MSSGGGGGGEACGWWWHRLLIEKESFYGVARSRWRWRKVS